MKKPVRQRKKNPDPVSMFAQLASGLVSVVHLDEMLNKRKKKTPKRRPAAKRNPTAKPASVRSPQPKARTANPKERVTAKGGNLYVLTIKRGDDVEGIFLHDGKGNGFSRRFASLTSAKSWATRNKKKLVANPTAAIKRKINGLIKAAAKPVKKANPTAKKPVAKKNGVLSRALARRRAAAELERELRAEAKLERIRARKAKAVQSPKKNPAKKAVAKRNPTAPRRKTFEMFNGRRVTNVRQLPVSRHAGTSPKLDQLGKLVELKLMDGRVIKFNPSRAVLAAKNGRMWIAGQKLTPPDRMQNPGSLVPIDHVDHVVYETFKPHHGDRPGTHYIHKLGEEGGLLPLLCVDSEGYPVLKGGSYKIRREGIRD